MKTWLACVASAVLAAILLLLTLGVRPAELQYPLNYLEDANIFLTKAKALSEGNWIWHNPRLGMPFGADWHDFPLNITFDSAVMWVISRFTASPPLIVNLGWVFGIALTAALATFAFVRLGFGLAVAGSFGVLFALLPYVYFRGTNHLHCLYYAVPLIGLAGIELIRSGRARLLSAAAGCVLAGVAYTYTAFFACFVLFAAGVIAYLRMRDVRALATGAALAMCTASVALLDLSSALIYRVRNGVNASTLFKSPAEAQLYALKIRYLITPSPDHPIPLVRAAERRLAPAKYPLFTHESEWGRLGTAGSIGFVTLVVFALAASVGAGGRFRDADLLGACAALMLACVLLGASGGFGDFFNAFVSPDIRAYARIFPFIAFFSTVAAALVVQRLLVRVRPAFGTAALVVLVSAAAFDQAVPSKAYDGRDAIYTTDRDFVRRIEAALPAESMVFQLPHTDFPNEILPGKLATNDLLRPYLHSSKYRWSWGAVSGTTPAEWNRQAAALPAADMLRVITLRGFRALWVDLAGYEPAQSPEAAITEQTGAPIRSADGRFLFYDLRAYADGLQALKTSMTGTDWLARNPVQLVFERGFYYPERAQSRNWRWSLRRGRITLVNPVDAERRVELAMRIETGRPGNPTVTVRSAAGEQLVRTPANYRYEFQVKAGGTYRIDLACDCANVQPADSPRSLAFFVSDVRVNDVSRASTDAVPRHDGFDLAQMVQIVAGHRLE